MNKMIQEAMFRDEGYITMMSAKYQYNRSVLRKSYAASDPFWTWINRFVRNE